MTTITTAAAFGTGWHEGSCCDCCAGYCVRYESPGGPFLARFTHAGRDWISDRYVALDAELLSDAPATDTPGAAMGRPKVDMLPTRAIGPATGIIGPRTLDLLARHPDLTLADSDKPGIHALTWDGVMVGFATVGKEGSGLPVEWLPRAWEMARHLEGVGESSLQAAARAIAAWLATEEAM